MSFIQNLFTSRDNNAQGNTYVGQQDRIWWDPVTNAFYYSDGNTAGGIPIGTASGNGIPGGPTNSVQINAGSGNFTGSSSLTFSSNVLAVGGNVTANYFIGNVSTAGNITGGNILSNNYLYANGNSIFANIQLTGNINLGNLYIIDETIYGKNTDQDIVLSPAGDAYVDVPKLKIAVGSLIQDSAQVNPIIASVTLRQVLANSSGPGDTLPAGSYGNPEGVTPPWAVYQFTTVPTPILEENDVIAGTGVPVPSIVQWVGNTSGTDSANANVVVTTGSYSDLPTPIPGLGNTITVTRAITLAGFNLVSEANTTINLTPGTAGNVIIGSSILPLVNDAFDLGSPTARWRSIYFGGNTIYVYDPVLGVDQSIGASNGNLVVGGGTGLTVGSFTFFGNTIAIADPVEDINIGTEIASGNVRFNRPVQVLSNTSPYPTFEVDREGLTTINVNSALPANVAALNVNGAASGNNYPRNFSATLVQLTNLDREPARVSMDAFGANVVTGQNAYGLLAARVARGNVDAPAQTQAGDIMMRLTSQGFNNAGAFQGTIVRYNQIASENFTTAAAGTRHNFQATPTGTVTLKNIANIDAAGLTLSSVANGAPANTGITFQDGSFQNTAYVASQAVNSVTAATGISIAPTSTSATGNITITNIGVITTAGTANQVFVNGANNISAANGAITLSLPQDIGTNSSPTFNTLTVNNLNILGNVSNVIPSVIEGKIVYVANTATQLTDIDTSGLVTGNAANGFYAGMLYQTTGAYANTWDFSIGNSQGIYAGNLYGDAGQFVDLVHVGFANATIDFPNASLQADCDTDSYNQIVLMNHNQGANASADFVAVANNGDDGNFYIDMGINSNVYNNSDYAVTGPNDGYLYVNGGNLIIGTQTAAKTISFFTGGTNSASRIRGTVSDAGLSMVGNVTANNLVGNTVSATTVSATGNVNAANVAATTITATNLVGTNITGTLQTAAQNNITSLGTLTSLSVTGTVTSGNIATAGNVSATGNVTGGNLVTSSTIINSGILTSGTISAAGNIISAANVTGGNIRTAGQVTATGNITGGNILTGGLISATSTITSGANITGGNIRTAGQVTATGNVTGGNIRTVGQVTATGNITGGNVLTAGLISATGNITGGNLVGQNLTAGRVAIVGSGKEVSDDADFTYNSSTNVLSVAGNVNASYFNGNVIGTGNITTTGNISASGNVYGNYGIFSGGNTVINAGISTTGNVTGNYFIGNGSQLTGIATGITTITPNALSSTVHIAATTVGNTANIITDATTANTANTIVVRDANGSINVSGWTVGTHLTAVSYTATSSDYWIGTTAKSRTITLPNAANGATNGRQYQIADTVHAGNPGTTIAAQSPATVVGNQPSQQGQIIIATYVGTTWYLN
jgi:hypothetical protein